MKKFDNFANEKDQKLLQLDRYTFFVLGKILKGDCTLVLTDHERIILCYSSSPHPVWVWTSDDVTKEEKEVVYTMLKENNFLDGTHKVNLKYDVANYVIKRAKDEDKSLSIVLNMFAYDCLDTKAPEKTDGKIVRATDDDVDFFSILIEKFSAEINIKSSNDYCKEAKELIATGNVYFWKNNKDEVVACCKYLCDGNLASLGNVFTLNEHRRKHYAENLVYEVTNIAKSEGYIPMLYTDADYVASNACYEKVGYILRGKLCTIN